MFQPIQKMLPFKIAFRARLNNVAESQQEQRIQIQIFDAGKSLWSPVWTGISTIDGIVSGEWVISEKNYPVEPLAKLAGEEIGLGGIPRFRMVGFNGSRIPTTVLSGAYWAETFWNSSEMRVDFGEQLQIAPQRIDPRLSSPELKADLPLGTIPAPDPGHILRAAFETALLVPEQLGGFNSKTHDFLRVEKIPGKDLFALQKEGTATAVYSIEGGKTPAANLVEILPGNIVKVLQEKLDEQQRSSDQIRREMAETLERLQAAESDLLLSKMELEKSKQEQEAMAKDLASAKAELESVLTAQRASMPIDTTLKNIMTDLSATHEKIDSQYYSLTNVKLDLKALMVKSPIDDKVSLQMLDPEMAKAVDGNVVSSISLEISPAVATQPVPNGIVPNVLGMTESLVRQKLHQAGLKLNPVYSSIQPKGVAAGHSYKQSPGPGSDEVRPGDVITVAFAKPKLLKELK